MKEKGQEIKIDIKTPEEILRDTSSQFKSLDFQATKAITEKNGNLFRQKLQERAQIIVGLPLKIQKSINNGNSFSEPDMEDIEHMSLLAKEALESKSDFRLGSFLESKGSSLDDPNYLDELIDRLYPSE